MANEHLIKDWSFYRQYDEKKLKYAIRIGYQEWERITEIALLLQEDGTSLLSALYQSSSMTAGYGIDAVMPKSTSGHDSDTEMIVQKRIDLQEELKHLEGKRDHLWDLINTLDAGDEEEGKMRSVIMFIFEGGSFRKYEQIHHVGKSTAERWFSKGIRKLIENIKSSDKGTLTQSLSI